MRFCFPFAVAACAFFATASLGLQAEAGSGTRPRATATRSSTAVPVSRVDPRSGQQVRTIVVAPRPIAQAPASDPAATAKVKNLVQEAAQKFDVSPDLIDSVIQAESNYNPFAVSPKGAQGLMQLMPDTARRFGVQDVFDPRDNILGGVKYLRFLQDTFKDDKLAVAAYNAGEGAVTKYNGVPPFPETQNYVAKIGKRVGKTKKAAENEKTPAAIAGAKDDKPVEPQYAPVRQYQDAQGRVYLTTQ